VAEAKWLAQLRLLMGVNREWRKWSSMVYPDLTHKVAVYGPSQSYTEGEGTEWGTAFRGLLQRRLAFWNTTYEECLGMATPERQWLQESADAVVQDAVTFDMHEPMQHD